MFFLGARLHSDKGGLNKDKYGNNLLFHMYIPFLRCLTLCLTIIVDGVHLSVKGYWVWAKALRSLIDRDSARLASKMAEKNGDENDNEGEDDKYEDEEEKGAGGGTKELSDTQHLVKIGSSQD